ncbi:unnamed protein product [Strongylus vulgaris]|uniref:C2H2-type domain-containing protein n=1 Tax=Strongylus vulgaris TaxID=40348 RepID=A0A3P7JBF2_STRVU|nr:unnamed protein product [Strongylus vulgaris]
MKYACDFPDCRKTFPTCGLLEDHIKMHQGVRPYNCANCGCSFFARARFAVHLSKYHRTSIRDYYHVSGLLKRDPPSDANDCLKHL